MAASPPRLRVALLVSLAGAVLTVVGVGQGLVVDSPAAGFGSGFLLTVLAVAPTAAAVLFVLFGRAIVGAGVLTGAALLAPGLALVDAQFLVDALQAARPEMLVPTSLAALTPGAGAYLVLAGHVAAGVAGVLAAGRAGADPSSDYFAALDSTASVSRRGAAVGWALAAATISVAGLFFPPFRSDNAFLLAHDLVDSPALVRYGGILLALTLLVGWVAAAGNARPPTARGMSVGLLLALAWLALPQVFAVAAIDWLHFERGGGLLTLVPLVVLVGMLFVLRGDREPADEPAELQLETSPLHLLTGVLGVLTGVAAIGGAVGALVVVEGGDQPASYANRQLIPAGIVVILLGAALFTRWAGAVRPAFVVSLGAVALVGLASLDAAFTGTTIPGTAFNMPVVTAEVHVGAGVWFAIAAIVLAAFAAVAAAIAGGAERDDVDLSERKLHTRVAIPVGAAILLAVGAFAAPMIVAPEFTAPGIFSEFRLASWGLLIGFAVVAGAAAVAAFSRPVRAAGLLFGGAVVVGVHLLELPMTGDRVADASAGQGTWLSLACLVALVAGAVAAMTDRTE
ncbi:hypothetical protein [Actinophytocola algeriensis]|uniref:hypothetical protein n=1 Tax=Actinophytocola algeriensis TaxID=1768010 RepID=UPI001A02225D|nr:hypothetical protein [Actinophytocola algeriensis]MBE1477405.1 hypothetical protein [Actinophytocola algeriensis]